VDVEEEYGHFFIHPCSFRSPIEQHPFFLSLHVAELRYLSFILFQFFIIRVLCHLSTTISQVPDGLAKEEGIDRTEVLERLSLLMVSNK
jgi:hypothetical protein